jgi:hypothetical protein
MPNSIQFAWRFVSIHPQKLEDLHIATTEMWTIQKAFEVATQQMEI